MIRTVTLSTLLAAAAVDATYSIVAVDSETQQVGGGVTSCVGRLDVGVVYASVPGVGVVAAQAALNTLGRDRAQQRLAEGVSPNAIIQEIGSPTFDGQYRSRQYAVVDLTGRAAGFTGSATGSWSGDTQAAFREFTYSAQGNILTSGGVVNQTSAGFESGGCDMAERLMRALEAGADNGEGDTRCTRFGYPSDSAFIRVDRPGEPSGNYLSLSVQNTAPKSPLEELRELFDVWRVSNPCPNDVESQ